MTDSRGILRTFLHRGEATKGRLVDNTQQFRTELTDEELAQIPRGFQILMRMVFEDDQWTALAMNFDIAGRGDTPNEAIQDTIDLLEEYLSYGFAEGRSFEEMLRPVPASIWARQLVSQTMKIVRRGRPGRRGRSSFHDEPFPLPRHFAHSG